MNRIAFVRAYVQAALWSTVGASGQFLDAHYTVGHIEGPSLDRIQTEWEDFIARHWNTLCTAGLSETQAGHDFWWSRNADDAGFCDRDLGELGERLSAAARSYGPQRLVEVHDGWLCAV
jgi:hypothetical protein